LFVPDLTNENAVSFSRFDTENPFSTCSAHPILLEDRNWLTCEHYYSYHIVAAASARVRVDKANTGQEAYDIARPWYRRKVSGWKNLRRTLMTRALYTKVQMYDEVREALLETEEEKILETSLYDYYWGLGRDQRGENTLGLIWMDIRNKITESAVG
jgi:ribA/ribD-fused uncharacterized protein